MKGFTVQRSGIGFSVGRVPSPGDSPPGRGTGPTIAAVSRLTGCFLSLFFLHFSLFTPDASAQAAPPDPARTFVEAARAYDEDRLPEAIEGWESLLAEGQVLPEVLFNLGNACYRNGDLGKAIRAYRHAQVLAPRDPDIRANLGFAAQTAGITLPDRNPLAQLLLDASQKEWMRIASLGYGLLFLALAAWILWPRFRPYSRPAAALAALVLVLALAGLWQHRALRRTPECVVMVPDQKVLSGPLDTATPLLAIPEGAIVRQLDAHGNWNEVQYETTRGWLPANAIQPVLAQAEADND